MNEWLSSHNIHHARDTRGSHAQIVYLDHGPCACMPLLLLVHQKSMYAQVQWSITPQFPIAKPIQARNHPIS